MILLPRGEREKSPGATLVGKTQNTKIKSELKREGRKKKVLRHPQGHLGRGDSSSEQPKGKCREKHIGERKST